MDEPSPWPDVAAQFAKIRREDHENVAAYWIASGWTAPGDTWYLSGTPNSRVHQHFKWAAERAAVILGYQPGPQTLFFWLDLLRANSPNYIATPHTRTRDGVTVEDDAGIVQSVCLASEEYCFKLETEYIADRPLRESRERSKGLSDIVRFRLTGGTIETPGPLPLTSLIPAQRPERPAPVAASQEQPKTVAEQLTRLRAESRLTVEALTDALGDIDQRNVERHLSGETVPRIGNIGAYERVFSNALKRKIVISIMPVKRR